MEELAAGPPTIQLPFLPSWLSSNGRMEQITNAVLKYHSSIKIIVRTAAEAERLIKQGLHFGERFLKVEEYITIGPDTLYPTYCHWGHTIIECPTPEKARCGICAEPHTTVEH